MQNDKRYYKLVLYVLSAYKRRLVRHSLREKHQVAELGERPLVDCARRQRLSGRLRNVVQLSTRKVLSTDRLATMLSNANLLRCILKPVENPHVSQDQPATMDSNGELAREQYGRLLTMFSYSNNCTQLKTIH